MSDQPSRRRHEAVSALLLLLAAGWFAACGPKKGPTTTPPTLERKPAYEDSSGRSRAPLPPGIPSDAVRVAESLLGVPYVYGGESRRGMDCSGLTSYAYSQAGRPIPRTAQQQASVGSWVALDELSAGDLVFFGDQRDKLYHVGLVVSGQGEPLEMIHSASSRGVVRTVVVDSAYWLRRLEFGRRVVPN